MLTARGRFIVLTMIVLISGFSQGMLLPVIAIIFEKAGVSSTINGLHATSIYIGILIASPFMEKPVLKFGFRPLLIVGGMIVFLSFFSFTLCDSIIFWFILRMLIGIGDQMIHFGSQTWITSTVNVHERGKFIAIYSLSFSLGFAAGPLMTRLIDIHVNLPFIVSSLLSISIWLVLFLLKNERPQVEDEITAKASSIDRFIKTVQIGWTALLPGFCYGFLEATLHAVFPVYGLRIGHDVGHLSFIIPLFAFGSIITLVPLGTLSDQYGRRKILLIVLAVGIFSFMIAGLFESSVFVLYAMFLLAGMFVGCLFSLGLSYMVDLLPPELIPAGNLMFGIAFSTGSIVGPFVGGMFIEQLPNVSFFYLLVVLVMIVFLTILLRNERHITKKEKTVAI